MVLPTQLSATGPADLTEIAPDLALGGSTSSDRGRIGHDGDMEDELEVLRREIDAVDERFVELLAERFRITRRVGRIKAERGLPAQDAIREAEIDAKVRRLAAEYDLDESLVSDVLRAVIDRVVAEHRELNAG
jgi:chorismate mutase